MDPPPETSSSTVPSLSTTTAVPTTTSPAPDTSSPLTASSAPSLPAGLPDESTTGPSDESLVPDQPSPRIVTSSDGQVIEDVHTTGVVVVHDDVTIRNFRITRDDPDQWFAIALLAHSDTGADVAGTVIEDGQIVTRDTEGRPLASGGTAVNGSNLTVRRLDISYVENGVACSDCLVEDNFIHDLIETDVTHNDGFQAGKGENIIIRHNTILLPGQQTSSVILGTSAGPIDNVLIEQNLLDGGAYTIFSRDSGNGPPTNVTIKDNFFGRNYLYGVLSDDGPVAWENNVWADTGEPVAAP
jgi:hypothetical protein